MKCCQHLSGCHLLSSLLPTDNFCGDINYLLEESMPEVLTLPPFEILRIKDEDNNIKAVYQSSKTRIIVTSVFSSDTPYTSILPRIILRKLNDQSVEEHV